jgi:hypothetical protein
MARLQREYLSWAEKTTATEHVSFRSFVKQFDLSDKDSATREYEELIKSERISRKRQITLKRSFVHFRVHFENRFWAKRALEVHTEEVADRAGLDVHNAGEVQSKAAFDKFLSKSHADYGPHYEGLYSVCSLLCFLR